MDVAVTSLTTRRGITCKVHTRGAGDPLVWFHGAGGLLPTEPMLDALAERCTVHAPEWPGFGEESTETQLDDMLDFALHGWDVIEALGLSGATHVVGHSMGGMIAAEMAALQPSAVRSLTLVDAVGLWLDDHPIPDIFSMLPFELADVLFADPKVGEQVLTAGLDFTDDRALTDFMVRNARRLGTAGKILFPLPNRWLSKRCYRITAPTFLLWGAQDRLVPPVYADRFRELLTSTDAELRVIDAAGHMLPYEQPAAAAAAVLDFIDRRTTR